MKKQLKFLLFAILMLTLVMMTMICVSAAADGDTQASVGDTFNEADYNFKVEDKDGNTLGYYINLGVKPTMFDDAGNPLGVNAPGGAWAAVPEGGKLILLKDVNYASKTILYLINSNSFTFDGQGLYSVTGAPNWKIQNGTDAATVGTNTIKFTDFKQFQSNNTMLELTGAGTKYQFEKVIANISGYGFYMNGQGATLELLGSENNVTSSGNLVYWANAATVIIDGGTYKVSGTNNVFHMNCGSKYTDNFDCVLTIKDGDFNRTATGGTDYNANLIALYAGNTKAQINISDGKFYCVRNGIILIGNPCLADINITGGEFTLGGSSQGFVYIHAQIKNILNATIGGKKITSSIDISNATISCAGTGMPVFCFRTAAAVLPSTMPLNVNIDNCDITYKDRFMVLTTGGYHNVNISNSSIKSTTGTKNLIQVQKTACLTLEMNDCDVACTNYFMLCDGTGTVSATINGGTYSIPAGILSRTSTATATVNIAEGDFTVKNTNALYTSGTTVAIKNADAESNALDVNFRISTVTSTSDFTQMTALYNAATNKAKVTVTAGYTHTVTADLENVDGPAVLKTAANLTNVPDYMKLDISLIVQNGATVTFTGGKYTTENSYFVRVDNGKVVATGITLNSLYRAFYITQADASVEVELNNCAITVADGHVLQGSTGSDSIAKLYLTINGGTYVAKGNKNVFSFGATTDAKVLITAGDFDLTTNIGYVASAGTYTITGGTFKTGSACFNVVAAATFNLSGATFNSGSSLISIGEKAEACTITISDCVINAKSHVIYSANEAAHSITVKNSTLIQTVEEAMEVIKAAGATLKMTDSIVLANLATTILNDTLDVDAYAPTVKFAGESYLVYMTTEGAAINKAGAEIYMGLDEKGNLVDGIRFTSELSADVIALVKAAVAAGKTVSYGMVIAPADYVVAAGTFTKAALDEAFGSTNGKLDTKSVYVDVPAKNSLRDANNDGVYESFSAMLVNIKEANYTRAFAAVGYVVIDGEITYSAYNTVDNARSAQYVANVLLESGYYEGEEDMIAILNKYAGVAAE